MQSRRIAIHGSSLRHLAGTRLLCADIGDVTGSDLRPDGIAANWRLDLLAGGPPCQPFSASGSRRGLDDPRGQLFLDFVRLAEELQPRFILFENVAGLVTAKDRDGRPGGVLERVGRAFEKIGYACRFDLLNAADFGAPQRRVRLFMIGSRGEELPDFPAPTHARVAVDALLERRRPWTTLGDFMRTQPNPGSREIVRPTARRAPDLAVLAPGTGLRTGGIVEANRPGGHWGYRQDCFLADPLLPARTVRAAATPDWIRLVDGSLRRLTLRECANLQGFPPEWEFTGTIASRFRQVGNAVQGHVAQAIGAELLRAAQNFRHARPASADWPAYFHKRVRYTAMEHEVNGAHRAAARREKLR